MSTFASRSGNVADEEADVSVRAIKRMSPDPSVVSFASSVPSTPALTASMPEEASMFTNDWKSLSAR